MTRPGGIRRWIAAIALTGLAALLGAIAFLVLPAWKENDQAAEYAAGEDPLFIFQGEAFRPQADPEVLAAELRQEVAELRRAIPDSPAPLHASARLEFGLGRKNEAVEYWNDCARQFPAFAAARFGLASAAMEAEDYEAVVRHARILLALDPKHPEGPVLLAEAMLKLGRARELVPELEAVLRSGTATNPAVVTLGQACLQAGQPEKARRAFEIVLHTEPDNRHAHFGLAAAWSRLGNREAARRHREIFEQAVRQLQETRTERMVLADIASSIDAVAMDTLNEIGRAYSGHDNPEKAELAWRKAGAVGPKDIESRTRLVGLYEGQGRPALALRVSRQLRDLEPQNADAWMNVGLLAARVQRFDEARQALQRAVELRPNEMKYRQALAAVEGTR